MKKLFFILTAVLAVSFNVSAQKVLVVKDITPSLSVYPCGDRHEALLVFRCSEPFDLSFSSNVDRVLSIDVTSEGSEKVYNIILPTKAEGTSYRGRQITVMAPGFNKYYIGRELQDKEKIEYLVSDPYSSLRSLYYTSVEDGLELMQNGAFKEAIDKFLLAKNCPEYTEVQNSLDLYIDACDSSYVWYQDMKRAEKVGKYDEALRHAMKIKSAIPDCKFISSEINSLRTKFNEMCTFDRDVAQEYIKSGELHKARALLQHSIDIGSPYSTEAAILINDINNKLYKSDNHTRSFSYQYAIDRPIGFFTSSLRPKGIGAYFSIGINKGIIDLLASKLQPVSNPKEFTYSAGASFGLSIPVVPKYGWILVTPLGYTGGGYLSGDGKEYWNNVTWFHGWAPEIGVAAKLWRITLSYRFQYKYCIDKTDEVSEMMGKTGHILGIGFCW